ncbi:BfmA/BtgA family mobilization protein, partial [Arcticibacter tournemirensis]
MGDNNRSVKFSLEVDRKFEKVSGRLGRNKRTLFIQMVDYFYHTKKDPHDLNDEALKTSIIKGNQHLTGFIKTQEQSLLIPIKQDAERMVSSQRRILE